MPCFHKRRRLVWQPRLKGKGVLGPRSAQGIVSHVLQRHVEDHRRVAGEVRTRVPESAGSPRVPLSYRSRILCYIPELVSAKSNVFRACILKDLSCLGNPFQASAVDC
jgi:hypothetical protein